MKIKSKGIAGIVATSIFVLLILATTSAVVFSGLENEEMTQADTETTTAPAEPIDPIGNLFNWGIKIFLILILAVLILFSCYEDNKGLAVGFIIAESCTVIAFMFWIVGIEILEIIFVNSVVGVSATLLGLILFAKLSKKTS